MGNNSKQEWGISELRSANCNGSGQKCVSDITNLEIYGLNKYGK